MFCLSANLRQHQNLKQKWSGIRIRINLDPDVRRIRPKIVDALSRRHQSFRQVVYGTNRLLIVWELRKQRNAKCLKIVYSSVVNKMIKWSGTRADPDHHQKSTTSRGSSLARACQVWSTSVSAFVSYAVYRMTKRMKQIQTVVFVAYHHFRFHIKPCTHKSFVCRQRTVVGHWLTDVRALLLAAMQTPISSGHMFLPTPPRKSYASGGGIEETLSKHNCLPATGSFGHNNVTVDVIWLIFNVSQSTFCHVDCVAALMFNVCKTSCNITKYCPMLSVTLTFIMSWRSNDEIIRVRPSCDI